MTKFMLYFWMIGATGIFNLTPHNPFGINGMREAYIALSMLYIPLFFVRGPKGAMLFAAFIIPVVAVGYSAFRAHITYGQPFMAGLIEERRILQLWLCFPIIFHGRSVEHVIDAFVKTCLIAGICGMLTRLGLINGWYQYEISAFDGRIGRANFATNAILIATLYCTDQVVRSRSSRLNLAAMVIGFLFLVFVAQTRQIVIVFGVIATLRLVTHNGHAVLKLFLALGALAGIAYLVLTQSSDQEFAAKYLELLDIERLANSARAGTIAAIYENLSLWGNGALSLRWNGGFSGIFGPNFFLSDVGIFATLFRFGVIGAPVVLFATGWLIWRAYQSAQNHNAKTAITISVLAMILLLPTSAVLEHNAALLALIIAFGATYKSHQAGQNPA